MVGTPVLQSALPALRARFQARFRSILMERGHAAAGRLPVCRSEPGTCLVVPAARGVAVVELSTDGRHRPGPTAARCRVAARPLLRGAETGAPALPPLRRRRNRRAAPRAGGRRTPGRAGFRASDPAADNIPAYRSNRNPLRSRSCRPTATRQRSRPRTAATRTRSHRSPTTWAATTPP